MLFAGHWMWISSRLVMVHGRGGRDGRWIYREFVWFAWPESLSLVVEWVVLLEPRPTSTRLWSVVC